MYFFNWTSACYVIWGEVKKKLKYSVIKYLKGEGFDCTDTGKKLGANPILKIYDKKFRLKMVSGGPTGLIPCQNVILITLEKE